MNDGKVYCEKGESDATIGLAFALGWGLVCWGLIAMIIAVLVLIL